MSLVEHHHSGQRAGDGREDFASLRRGGLDWDEFGLHLFVTGNARFWDPRGIDFSTDALDWREMRDDERRFVTYLVAQICAGEAAVTRDVQPFGQAAAADGRLGDEMYLSQVAFEKAKHTEVFRLWMDAAGLVDDLNPVLDTNPFYRQLIVEELPAALRRMETDPSPENQIRAVITFHQVIGGTLACTGHHMLQRICSAYGILPGMRTLIRMISTDERRHMAWGTYTCRRLVAADDALADVAVTRMSELMPLALGMINWLDGEFAPLPFDLSTAEFIAYAADRSRRRLDAIGSARGLTVEQVEYNHSPEALEDVFGEEDSAALGS